MTHPVIGNPWVRALGAVGLVVFAVFLAYSLSFVLIPLFFAFIAAYLCHPVVQFFERRRIPRGVTIAVLALVGLLALLSFPVVLFVTVNNQAAALIDVGRELAQAPEEQEEQEEGWLVDLDRWLASLPLEQFVEWMEWTEEDEVLTPRAVIATRIGEYVQDHASQFFRDNLHSIVNIGETAGLTLGQMLRATLRGFVGLLLFLANFALFACVAGYLLYDFDGLLAGVRELIPPRFRQKSGEIARRIDEQLRAFLRGQLIVALCLGGMYAIGMLVAGTPFAIPIALFGIVVGFVPYLGITLTIGPAILLTLLRSGLGWQVFAVIAAFTMAQTIESYLLTPRIVGEKVGLGPVWVILAVLVFGNLFGFLGLLLAVPIAAVLKVLVVEGLLLYKASRLFSDSGEGGGE